MREKLITTIKVDHTICGCQCENGDPIISVKCPVCGKTIDLEGWVGGFTCCGIKYEKRITEIHLFAIGKE